MSFMIFIFTICSASVLHRIRFSIWPKQAFAGEYDDEIILKWLKTFMRRFFAQRSSVPVCQDGPKVGTVAVSPRGDLRMPSDACAKLWLDSLEKINLS